MHRRNSQMAYQGSRNMRKSRKLSHQQYDVSVSSSCKASTSLDSVRPRPTSDANDHGGIVRVTRATGYFSCFKVKANPSASRPSMAEQQVD